MKVVLILCDALGADRVTPSFGYGRSIKEDLHL